MLKRVPQNFSNKDYDSFCKQFHSRASLLSFHLFQEQPFLAPHAQLELSKQAHAKRKAEADSKAEATLKKKAKAMTSAGSAGDTAPLPGSVEEEPQVKSKQQAKGEATAKAKAGAGSSRGIAGKANAKAKAEAGPSRESKGKGAGAKAKAQASPLRESEQPRGTGPTAARFEVEKFPKSQIVVYWQTRTVGLKIKELNKQAACACVFKSWFFLPDNACILCNRASLFKHTCKQLLCCRSSVAANVQLCVRTMRLFAV